jgi:hypothetical protein
MILNKLDAAKGGRDVCAWGGTCRRSQRGRGRWVEEGEMGEVSSWAAVGCARV